MKPISDRYQYLYANFYYDKARERYDNLVQYAESYIENIDFNDKLFSCVDTIKVDAFITSYFLDVMRFKEYHFQPSVDGLAGYERDKCVHAEKLLNSGKVGAFTTKWLIKYSPVVLIPKEGLGLNHVEQTFLAFAPFAIALNFSLRLMDINPRDVPVDIHRDILYHIRFRGFDDRSFMLYYNLLVRYFNNSGNLESL
jgi:hypothetical protein